MSNYIDKVLGVKGTGFEAIGVVFHSFVPATADEEEHMLCYPFSDVGVAITADAPVKVFLKEDAKSEAQSIESKCMRAEVGKTAYILEGVKKDDDGNYHTHWVTRGNAVNRKGEVDKAVVLTGTTFIYESEQERKADNTIGTAMKSVKDKNGKTKSVVKNKRYARTVFFQHAVKLAHPTEIKDVVRQIFDNDSKSMNAVKIAAAVRLTAESPDGTKNHLLLHFDSKNKGIDDNYQKMTWDEMKSDSNVVKKWTEMMGMIGGDNSGFIGKHLKDKSVITLEVAPATLNYTGDFSTDKSLSHDYEGNFLYNGKSKLDANGNEIPQKIPAGKVSCVVINEGTRGFAKIVPRQFQKVAFGNPYGLDNIDSEWKTQAQTTKENTDAAVDNNVEPAM